MIGRATASRSNRILNAAGGFLTGYGFVAFFCFLGIVEHWSGTAPTAPAPTIGAILPHNDHGSITYFTAFQATSCALLFETSIPLVFIGGLIVPKRDIKSWGGLLAWRVTWNQDDPSHLFKWGLALGALSAPAIVFRLGPTLVHWLVSLGFTQGF